MPQPSFSDIGKSANNILNKGFNIRILKIDIKNKAGANKEYEIDTTATHDFKSEAFDFNVNLKYKLQQYGLILNEKWSSKSIVTTSLEFVNYFTKGLTLNMETNYNLKDNSRNAIFKGELNKPSHKVTNKINLMGTPVLDTTAVYGEGNFVAGLQIATDISKIQLKSYNFRVSRLTPDLEITGFINNGNIFGGTLFHRAGPNLDLAAEVTLKQDSKIPSYAIGCKYSTSNDLVLKAKVDSESCVSVTAKHNINSALSLTASTQFSLFSSNHKTNKLGFGIEFTS